MKGIVCPCGHRQVKPPMYCTSGLPAWLASMTGHSQVSYEDLLTSAVGRLNRMLN